MDRDAATASALLQQKAALVIGGVLALSTLGAVAFVGRNAAPADETDVAAAQAGASIIAAATATAAAQQGGAVLGEQVRAAPPAVGQGGVQLVTYASLSPAQAAALSAGLARLFGGAEPRALTSQEIDELARATGLTPAELTPILAQVMATGVVEVQPAPASRLGKTNAAPGQPEAVAGIQARAYGQSVMPTKLPKTGAEPGLLLAALGAVSAGLGLRLR